MCRKYHDTSWLQEKAGVPYTDIVIVSPRTASVNGHKETVMTTISAGMFCAKAHDDIYLENRRGGGGGGGLRWGVDIGVATLLASY